MDNDNVERELSQILEPIVVDQMARRLQGFLPDRDEAVRELIAVHPTSKELWVLLTPDERLRWIQSRLEVMINITPTGPERNALCDANVCVMGAMA